MAKKGEYCVGSLVRMIENDAPYREGDICVVAKDDDDGVPGLRVKHEWNAGILTHRSYVGDNSFEVIDKHYSHEPDRMVEPQSTPKTGDTVRVVKKEGVTHCYEIGDLCTVVSSTAGRDTCNIIQPGRASQIVTKSTLRVEERTEPVKNIEPNKETNEMTKFYKVLKDNLLYVEGAILACDSTQAYPIDNMFNVAEDVTDTQYIFIKTIEAPENAGTFERVYKYRNEAGKDVYGSRADAIASLKA